MDDLGGALVAVEAGHPRPHADDSLELLGWIGIDQCYQMAESKLKCNFNFHVHKTSRTTLCVTLFLGVYKNNLLLDTL